MARAGRRRSRGTYGAGASEEARGDRAWWRRTAPSTGVRRPGTNPNRGGGGRRGSIVRVRGCGGARSGRFSLAIVVALVGAPRYC